MRNAITGTIIAVMLMLIYAPAMAAVKLEGTTLTISGNTTRVQAAQVQQVLKRNDVERIVMWGNGGDFFSGLAIGLMIKESEATVQIPSGARCVSACAFAAIASKKILVGGELWFHKAYRPSYNTLESLEDIDKDGQRIGITLSYYAYKLDLPLRFMFEVVGTTTSCKFLVINSTRSARALQAASFDTDDFRYQRGYADTCHSYER